MRNRKAARRAGRVIALVGVLALVSPLFAGGLDDPGGPSICTNPTPTQGCEEMTVVQASPSPSTADVVRLLAWKWIATLLLRH